ncbi:MAG: TlpA family protein disulfide reductase [Hyphomicrobiaceae bacterium]
MMDWRPLFGAFLLAVLVSTTASAQVWKLAPDGYVYKPATPCLDDPVRASQPIRPGGAVYKVCEDQLAYLTQSIEGARQEGKLLIVTVGATWCPWCAALQRAMPGPEFFGRQGDPIDYAKTFKHIEVGLSATHKGRNALIYSGDAAVKALLARSGDVKLEAIPFLFIIDPTQPERIFARNTKDLSDFATGQQDMAGFRKAVAEGVAYLRAGKRAAAE